MTRAALLFLLLCFSQSPAAHSQGGPSALSAANRCYELHLGRWSNSLAPEGHGPPERIQLSSVLLAGRGGELGYHRVQPGLPIAEERGGLWRPVSPDSMEIGWSDGFSGMRIVVAEHGDTLTGAATAIYDDKRANDPTAPVVAVRISCASVDSTGTGQEAPPGRGLGM